MNDDLRNVLISLTAAAPYFGGPLAFLLDKYVPSEIERRQNEYLKMLEKDMEDLRDRILPENFERPEFQSVFLRLLKQSREESRREKIDAFRNITLNMLTSESDLWKLSKVEFFVKLSISLVPDELRLLYLFYLLDVRNELSHLDVDAQKRDIHKIIKALWADYDEGYVFSLLMDCARFFIISGNAYTEKIYKRKGMFLTPLGKEFLTYIFSPIDGRYYE